jgi:recombination protein RecA
VKRTAAIKLKEEIIGHIISAKIAKNKMGIPLKVAEIHFLYDRGICNEWDVLDHAVQLGVLTKAGAYIKDKEGTTLGQGEYNAMLFLNDNPEYFKQLNHEILQSISIQD